MSRDDHDRERGDDAKGDRERGDDAGGDHEHDVAGGGAPAGWPVALRGVTESVVATLGPNGRWNQAALGLHAPAEFGDDGGGEADGEGNGGGERNGEDDAAGEDDRVTAVTWGNTRTRRNFSREGGGVVQFTVDPVDFVDAALSVRETEEPILEGADAWVRVAVEQVDSGTRGGTRTATWALSPVESEVRRERVPTINRGFGAVVDATVAASRLDVDDHETTTLLDRLAYFADVVDRCGGARERRAFARIDAHVGWRERARNESL